MKNIVSWFANNHVAANLLMIFALAMGILTTVNSKVEIFPETASGLISVSVSYPGATPSEIEKSIVKRIEEGIAGIEGVKSISSTASEGIASIIVEVRNGWNTSRVLDDVKAEVDRITTLPDESEKPIIRELTIRAPVINIAVYGDSDEHTIRKTAQDIKDDVTALKNVSEAEIIGIRDPEIDIEIPEANLRKYHISLEKVAQIVRNSSIDLAAGNIKTKNGEILVRTKERKYYAKKYRDIVVASRNSGARVKLSDIADIKEGFENVDRFFMFEGKPAAIVQVFRVGDENALSVAHAVKNYIRKIKHNLPAGIRVKTFNDRSQILKSRIDLLLKNMGYGMILVILTLGIFLDKRLSLWITMGIPTAFAFGLWLLPHFNVSINMISLFALVMVLGIVVDDAIVIGESIYQKREEGLNPIKASIEGTVEVAVPVIFSVLTTMAAFWPLLNGTGVMGKIIRNIPVVVILVLLGSILEALLILPSHLARSKIRIIKTDKELFIRRYLRKFINGPYKKMLRFSLKWRYGVVAFGIFLLMIIVGLWAGNRIEFTYFPKVEGNWLVCDITLPAGSSVSTTEAIAKRIENDATEVIREAEKRHSKKPGSLMKYIAFGIGVKLRRGHASAGSSDLGSNFAQIVVSLVDSDKRKGISSKELLRLWRKKVGDIPEAQSLTFQSEIFSAGKSISINLSDRDENALHKAVESLKSALKKYPGVYDVSDSFLEGKRELELSLKPEAKTLGLTAGDLAEAVHNAFYGAEALRLQRGRDEIKVMVRYPLKERRMLSSIRAMRIIRPDGSEIPLSEVARIKEGYAAVSINRYDQQRVITVDADVDEAVENANDIRKSIIGSVIPKLMKKFPGLKYTLQGEGKEQKESMSDIMRSFMIALLLIYILLAVPLKSFLQPVFIMLAIPFGVIGAVLGHIALGMNLSILSLFGIVGLSGVVVNDALVLFDAINRRRKKGMNSFNAIIESAISRFRAIMLTTLTTVAGLLPIISETSLQAKFLIPMAISLAAGVLFATLITLLLVPCGYLIMEDILRLVKISDKHE